MKKSKFLSNVSHKKTDDEITVPTLEEYEATHTTKTQEKSGFDWWGLTDGLMGLTGKFIDTKTEAEKAKQAQADAAQAQALADMKQTETKSKMTPWLIGGGVVVVLAVILIVVLKK